MYASKMRLTHLTLVSLACVTCSIHGYAEDPLSLAPFMTYHRGELRSEANNIVGSRFVASQEQEVTHLGYYDEKADGLSQNQSVALFETGISQAIATAEIPSGTEPLLAYGCRWVELPSSVTLQTGKSYAIVAEVTSDADPFLNTSPSDPECVFEPSLVSNASPVVPLWGPPSQTLAVPPNELGEAHANRSYLAGNFATFKTLATTQLALEPETEFQTIKGFGASDAWNLSFVAEYWEESEREGIAKLLFSQDADESGNPLGIGLSSWRFNIGAGTAEQGDASGITNETRRTESFLSPDGTYDWTKQAGQRWFLEKAHQYGVEETVAFSVSPPVQFTKNQLGHLSAGQTATTNLRDDAYDDFAEFLATVLKRFQDQGIPFDYLSPLNEPQYNWNSEKQEGSYWSPQNIAKVAREVDTALQAQDVSTKQTIDESGHYDHLLPGYPNRPSSIESFFNPQSDEYIGNLSTVEPTVAVHSYYTYYTNNQLLSVRQQAAQLAASRGVSIRQTEYSLLAPDSITEDVPHTYADIALFLAKIIQADLTAANVDSWSFWTAVEQEFGNHKNRFALVGLLPDGETTSLRNGGTHAARKTLWSLGNFSRFVRPGFKRIQISGADNPGTLFGSAYLSPDQNQKVIVLLNSSFSEQSIQLQTTEDQSGQANYYLTDREHDLTHLGKRDLRTPLVLPPRSVATFTLTDSPWQSWLAEYLENYEATERTFAADPDQDGASNIFEYASGTSPVDITSVFVPSFSTHDNASANLSFRLSSKATDLNIIIQESTNLNEWQDSPHRIFFSQGSWNFDSPSLTVSRHSTGEESDEEIMHITIPMIEYSSDQPTFDRIQLSTTGSN